MTTAFSISNAQGKRVEGEAPRSEYRKAAKEMADQLSTAEYTPTTEEIREYVEVGGEPRPWLPPTPEKDALRAAAFDRWLVAHDREVAAKAWDEGNAEPGSGLPRCPACDDRTVSQHRRGDVDEWWHDDDGTVICGGSFTDAVWKDHNPYRAALGVPEEAEHG